MTLIVDPKNKNEEKILKAFLNSLNIGFHTQAEEDAALYAAMLKGHKSKLLNKEEKNRFIKKISGKK